MRMPPGFGLLREALALRHYRLYAIANMSSNVGVAVQRVAIGWLTWELTHSTAWLGIISFAEAAPLIVFGIVAGTLVDRADQIKLLRVTRSLSLLLAGALAIATLAGFITIWLLTGLVLLRGTINSFGRPTRMTVVYGLVGRDLLPTALALNSMIFNASRFLGPALGGAIIAWTSTGWSFAAAFLLFLPINWALRAIDQANITMPAAVTPGRRSIWTETIDGIRYILGHRGIRTQLLLLIVTAVCARPVSDLFPGFAAQVFARGSSGLAWLLSFYGAGAMFGAAWMSSRGSLKGLTRITLANILLTAVALLLFVATDLFWIACALAAVIGFAFIVQNVSNQTLIQSAIHSSLRGRVMSIYSMIGQGVPSLGTMFMGAAAAHWHLRLPVAIGAVICVGLWAWAWRLREPLAAALEHHAPLAPAGAAE
jgi:predicted MFS family arabinose efflux permease